jgi:hypothetical protein
MHAYIRIRVDKQTRGQVHTLNSLCSHSYWWSIEDLHMDPSILRQSKTYNPDLWSRDPDVVLKYLPTESDGPLFVGAEGKCWSLWQCDKFKYARLLSLWMVEGSLIKLFPCKFSLSKPLNSPIASGTIEILQKLKSRKIKDPIAELTGIYWYFMQPYRSKVIRDVILSRLSDSLTSFVQSLKLKTLSFGREPWNVDKLLHWSTSRYSRFSAPVKSGVLFSFVQPERRKTLSDHNLNGLPKSRWTRLLHFCKLKNTSSERSPIDGCTCSKFMHPVRSSRSRFRIPSKHGVIFRFLELLRSILFKQGRHCLSTKN